MPKRISYGGQIHEFPDNFSDDDIQQALMSSDTPATPTAVTDNKIGADPGPQTMGGKVEQFGSDLLGDIRNGTTNTVIGRAMHSMGAQGTSVGSQAAAGNFMGSPALGTARMIQGSGQASQDGKRIEGAKNIVGGALDAATIPSMVVNPTAGTIGTEAVANAGKAAVDLLPSTTRAGKTIGDVAEVANKIPVQITNKLGDILLEAKALGEAGSNPPRVISKFLSRITDPKKGEMTYEEARRFYQNASRLSSQETLNANPPMLRQLGMFTDELKKVIYNAADQVGAGDLLKQGMNEYRAASVNASRLSSLKDTFMQYAKYAIPGAAAAYGAKKIIEGK